MLFGLRSNGFIGDRHNHVRVGSQDNIISGVDHPRFKSDRATSNDDMHVSPRHQCRTIDSTG
jgi:hypothetical protein